MKKVILLILMISTLKVVGQNHLAGIKGGASQTNVTASNFTSQNEERQGIMGGITYEYFCGKHFSVGADAIYNQRGFTNDIIFTDERGNPTGGKATTKFNYDYLSLPIKTGFSFGNKAYVMGNIGLVPSILINAETETPTIDIEGKITGSETFDVADRVTKFDLAGVMEVGCGFKFRNRYWLYSALGYQYSFTTITNSDYSAESKVKHTGITLSLGLKYSLSEK